MVAKLNIGPPSDKFQLSYFFEVNKNQEDLIYCQQMLANKGIDLDRALNGSESYSETFIELVYATFEKTPELVELFEKVEENYQIQDLDWCELNFILFKFILPDLTWKHISSDFDLEIGGDELVSTEF